MSKCVAIYLTSSASSMDNLTFCFAAPLSIALQDDKSWISPGVDVIASANDSPARSPQYTNHDGVILTVRRLFFFLFLPLSQPRLYFLQTWFS